jgi:NADPH:quinone reductase-like Zn-dependent oxidoreductase
LVQLLQHGSNETRRYLSDIMHKVFVLYKEGKIKPVVDSVFTFEDVSLDFTATEFIFEIVLGKQCSW